jgi:hypothetical protein
LTLFACNLITVATDYDAATRCRCADHQRAHGPPSSQQHVDCYERRPPRPGLRPRPRPPPCRPRPNPRPPPRPPLPCGLRPLPLPATVCSTVKAAQLEWYHRQNMRIPTHQRHSPESPTCGLRLVALASRKRLLQAGCQPSIAAKPFLLHLQPPPQQTESRQGRSHADVL